MEEITVGRLENLLAEAFIEGFSASGTSWNGNFRHQQKRMDVAFPVEDMLRLGRIADAWVDEKVQSLL